LPALLSAVINTTVNKAKKCGNLSHMQLAKKALRREILAKRRGLGAERIHAESAKITDFLCTWPVFTQADTVMFFLSMPDEVQTWEIITYALAAGKKVCVPHLGEERGQMTAVCLKSLDELVTGKFDIQTVANDKVQVVQSEVIDLILVPGVAFDAAGRRCGMGAGYYDRFLLQAPQAILAGACLSCQLVARVPCAEYDQLVQYIVTANGIVVCAENQ
jgi:5-formyltetrahydrofolate cyclo-ligase